MMGNMPAKQAKIHKDELESLPADSKKRDIDLLFGSVVRGDVLWSLLQYPEESFTQGDIVKITGRDPKDVRRVLDALEQLGLIHVRTISCGGISSLSQAHLLVDEKIADEMRTRGIKRYGLNNDHPWVPALKVILENSSMGAIPVLREELRRIRLRRPEVAFVFGSFAVGDQTSKSDIDLIVIGYHDREALADMIDGLERRIGRSIDYFEYTPEEWIKALRDNNGFATSIMTKPKLFLIGDNEGLERLSKT